MLNFSEFVNETTNKKPGLGLGKVKFVSNKDGNNPGWKGFTSYSPNTYKILNSKGEEIGSVYQNHRFPLESLNPNWKGVYDKVWVATGMDGKMIAAHQLLSGLKAALE